MKRLCKWSSIGICVFLGILTLLLAFPGLLGIHPLLVQSGSMEPDYPKGSVIYVRDAKPQNLSEGTVVTFCLPDGETLVTHRIVRVDPEQEEIYTKGDANELADKSATPYSMIVGIPMLCVPGLGYLAGYLASAAGRVGIILLVVLVCLLSWMEEALVRQEEQALQSRESTCTKTECAGNDFL